MTVLDSTLATLPSHSRSVVLLFLLAPALYSCSSSSSETQSAVAPFIAPIDAESLRVAIATGSSSEPSGSAWTCNLSDGISRFSYQLLTDGTGTEVDANDPSRQSNLRWETTSASTMVTTFNTSSQQLNLTNIQFSNRDAMTLSLSQDMSLSCLRESASPIATPSSQPGPAADNQSLNYGGINYPLTTSFEETYRFRPDSGDNHSHAELSVSDDVFLIFTFLPIGASPGFTIWSPSDESIWLRADLYAPGGGGIVSGTYTYEPDSTDDESASLIGQNFFQDGHVHADLNGDGEIEKDDNEELDITGGTITITRSNDITRMSFDVTLENGVPVTGSYEGTFPLFENF